MGGSFVLRGPFGAFALVSSVADVGCLGDEARKALRRAEMSREDWLRAEQFLSDGIVVRRNDEVSRLR
jgi:hypothetical protein